MALCRKVICSGRFHERREVIAGFTLVEVVMSIAVVALAFGTILTAYIQATQRAEWSGYSLAAQALAIQQLEQARSAKWDVLDTPTVDEITNLPPMMTNILDLPISGTNVVIATNFITVSTIMISTNPPVPIHMVRVDTVWAFHWKSVNRLFTNTAANYYAPDR